jgi:hypothetical protein
MFQDLGVNALTGVNLLEWLDVAPEELAFPQRFSKLQAVIEFLNPFPEDTQRFLINKATLGKQVDKLEHMFEYTALLQRKYGYEQSLKKIEHEKSVLGFDPSLMDEVQLREDGVKKDLDLLLAEIRLYEK